ncbi:MAG: helix-turn-helix domain-containing protein [Clostridium sp.]
MINLEKFRKERKITIYRLHKITGISRSYLKEIEKGNSDPTATKIILLCVGLGITPNELLDWKVTKE